MGLSINKLMREVMIQHGLSHAEASEITHEFAAAFEALTGTEWLEVNGNSEWRLTEWSRKAREERLQLDAEMAATE
jgi:hypothetical protein